jgi:hypothetical protein
MVGAKHSQYQLDQVAAIARPRQPIQARSDQECFAPTAQNIGQTLLSERAGLVLSPWAEAKLDQSSQLSAFAASQNLLFNRLCHLVRRRLVQFFGRHRL